MATVLVRECYIYFKSMMFGICGLALNPTCFEYYNSNIHTYINSCVLWNIFNYRCNFQVSPPCPGQNVPFQPALPDLEVRNLELYTNYVLIKSNSQGGLVFGFTVIFQRPTIKSLLVLVFDEPLKRYVTFITSF